MKVAREVMALAGSAGETPALPAPNIVALVE